LKAADAIVEVRGLSRVFDGSGPWVSRLIGREPRQMLTAVDSLDFAIDRGETFGLVGESGSGNRRWRAWWSGCSGQARARC
jgi:peptide/nickel transport system ATP-binding protein